MKKTIKANTAKVTQQPKYDFFWKKNGRNYQLVDKEGNPARVLPVADVNKIGIKNMKEAGIIPDENGKQHIWKLGHLDFEPVKAPIWKNEGEFYVGSAYTMDTIEMAESYLEYITKRLQKLQRREVKKNFNDKFDELFNADTKDGVCIFWKPEEHPEFSGWEQYLDTEKYTWYMRENTEESDENECYGLVFKKDIVEKVQNQEFRTLHIKVPEEIMTKVRDREFIGACKHHFGFEFIWARRAVV